MNTDAEPIEFKTDARKGACSDTFKTAIELELIQRFTIGRDILDIGTGTGRVAIPFARQGYRVVAVDASAATIDQTRSIADGVPIDLRVGDIDGLPVPDACIDTAISRNYATRFPNWNQYLLEWKRVMRPGGRLVFDVGSMDHIDAVSRALGKTEEQLLAPEGDVNEYHMRLRWLDLLEFCNEHGLRLVALVPVGMLFGAGDRWQQNGGMARHLLWERMLEMMAHDSRLFAFGKFIEQEIVGCLSPEVTGSIFVVLENVADPEANARLRARTEVLTVILSSPPKLSALAPYLRSDLRSWRAELAEHMDYPPNRVFAFMPLTAMPASWFDSALLDHVFGQDIAALLRDWDDLRALELAVDSVGRSWYAEVPERYYDGVDLGSIMQYGITGPLIAPSRETRARSLQ
jgi:SAM-dependent methyltransferase